MQVCCRRDSVCVVNGGGCRPGGRSMPRALAVERKQLLRPGQARKGEQEEEGQASREGACVCVRRVMQHADSQEGAYFSW